MLPKLTKQELVNLKNTLKLGGNVDTHTAIRLFQDKARHYRWPVNRETIMQVVAMELREIELNELMQKTLKEQEEEMAGYKK